MSSATVAGSVMTKMFVVAVDGVDPAQLVVSLVKDVVQAICGAVTNLIEANNEYANPPSPVMFGSNFYLFYQNGSTGQLVYGLWNGSTWTTNNPVSSVTNMTAGPGAVVFDNTLYVFYQKANSSGQLWYTTSTDGTTWTTSQQVPNIELSDSPSAAVFNGTLYVFFNNSGGLGYCTSSNGTSWSGMSSVPNLGMSCSPAALVYNSTLYVFHQGSADNGQLWYDTSSNGTSWSGDTRVSNVGLVGAPSAIAYNDEIYVFHSGNGNNVGQVWYSTYDGQSWAQDIQAAPLCLSASPSTVVFTPPGGEPAIYNFNQGPSNCGVMWCNVYNGTQWASIEPVEEATIMSCTPGPVVFNDTLYVFYQGESDNGQLLYATSSDGSNWTTGQVVTGAGITDSPSAVVFNGTLYVFYQGKGNSDELWYSYSSDGSTWSSSIKIAKVGIYYSPSAVVYNGTLYVFHMGTEDFGDGQLWYVTSSDGSTWSSDNNPQVNGGPIMMCNAPSAVVYNNRICVLSQGPNNDGGLTYSTFSGGSSAWSSGLIGEANVASPLMTNSPSAVVFGGNLYCYYQGAGNYTWSAGTGQLCYWVFNGNSWTSYPPRQLSSSATSPTGVIVSLTQDEWNAVNAAGDFLP